MHMRKPHMHMYFIEQAIPYMTVYPFLYNSHRFNMIYIGIIPRRFQVVNRADGNFFCFLRFIGLKRREAPSGRQHFPQEIIVKLPIANGGMHCRIGENAYKEPEILCVLAGCGGKGTVV